MIKFVKDGVLQMKKAKSLSKATKWHYHDAKDSSCKLKTGGKVYHFTRCGIMLSKVRKFTEFKSRVNCLRCLKIINRDIKK